MCTLTWIDETEGYQLFFNRDELRTRRDAIPPAIRLNRAVRFVAPLDGDFGGSWIAVNEFGLTLCLLNGHRPADRAPTERDRAYTSRGLLLTALTDCRSASEVLERTAGMQLEPYRPFWLVVFEPAGELRLARWEAGALETPPPGGAAMPLVSSSFATDAVRASRTATFERLRERREVDPTGAHLAYHRSHEPAAGPHSTCMHRPEAETVSFSWIRVGPRRIRFHYAPHAPHLGIPDQPAAVLDRAD